MNAMQQPPSGGIPNQYIPAMPNMNQITDTLGNAQENLSKTMDSFSKAAETGVEQSSGFLESNTIIAKFAFIILILFICLVLMNLGVSLLGYLFSPSQNPYLIKGMIDGNFSKIITQDPGQTESKPIFRSNDESTGIEFTWSSWLYINDLNTEDGKYQHIFSKGDGNFDTTTNLATINNAPGVYLKPKENTLRVLYNSVSSSENVEIDIPNIPMKKWVHVALRLQNKILDIYVNGVVAERRVFNNTPKQNFGDVYVAQNGGFIGKLSNLRYYSRALNVFEITAVVNAGPNLSVAEGSYSSGDVKYLSNMWYSANY